MDRKTLLSLVAVTAAFLFFTSEPWHKIVRKVFHLPDPPAVTETVADTAKIPVKESKPQEASTASLSEGDAGVGAKVADTVKASDSVQAVHADSMRKLMARHIVIRTPTLQAVVSGKGGRIESLRLLGIEKRGGGHPDIVPQGRGGALALKVEDMDLANEPFSVEGQVPDTVVLQGKDSLVLKMFWIHGGHAVRRVYVFRAGNSSVGMDVQPVGWDKPAVKLSWDAGLLQIDPPGPKIPFGPPHFNNLVWLDNEDVNNHNDDKPVTASTRLAWVGLRTQYALAAVSFPGELREGELSAERIKGVDSADENSFKWAYRWHPQAKSEAMELAVTPLEVKTLKEYGVGYEKVLFSGYAWFLRADLWFPALCLFVLGVLQFLHGLVPNYGIAIILLTLIARSALLPLTIKQVRQSKRMAEIMPKLKPQLDAAKEKFKSEPQKLQQETMRIYAEHGVNPIAQLGGCLPMLFQMPVFIALYQVLGRAIELRGQPFFAWIQDLARPDVVTEIVKIPYLFPAGITILPLFMAASMWGLNKLTIKDPQQAAMVWIMPIMMLVFSGSMPSGLVLYWTVSNLFSLTQTWLVNAGTTVTPAPVAAVASVNGKKSK